MPAPDRKPPAPPTVLPRPVERALHTLGQDISAARRMRRLSQEDLAQRAGASVSTIRRMEDGHPGTALHAFLRTLQVLGRLEGMTRLMALESDDLGLELVKVQLPQRIRTRGKKSGERRSAGLEESGETISRSDELEGF
ncbi:MAG: helix-turn-helix domain-containing protein [Gammaproteobacteria bacterium]|nr:helix-turn-helix domain-containing protein [Gammaproteobacteria bacterium]